jgi:hypothetical protein
LKPDRLLVAMPSAADDKDECPTWCEHEHLGEGTDNHGYHHDGAVMAIALDVAVVPGNSIDLFVNVSQHAQKGEPLEPSLIEVQDEHQTLFLLTPVECLALSRALLAAAAEIATEEVAPTARVAPLVRDLEKTLARWRGEDTG